MELVLVHDSYFGEFYMADSVMQSGIYVVKLIKRFLIQTNKEKQNR